MTEEELNRYIEGCKKNDRKSQKALYQSFYGYAMSICLRYAGSTSEASEILNDGFFKVFTQMHKYDNSRPFKPWLSRIMCNASIDHCRANTKKRQTVDLEKAMAPATETGIVEKLDYEYLLALVQKLPPGYRMVFNLFVIDGYTHEEIAARLKINVGTSRSNLFKARQNLQQMLKGTANVDIESKDTPIVPINQSFMDTIFHSKSRKP